jgi:hypothetical protein
MKTGFINLDVQELQSVNGGWILPALLFQLAMEVIDGSFFEDVSRGYRETSGR